MVILFYYHMFWGVGSGEAWSELLKVDSASESINISEMDTFFLSEMWSRCLDPFSSVSQVPTLTDLKKKKKNHQPNTLQRQTETKQAVLEIKLIEMWDHGSLFVWPKGALHPFWSESGIQSCESGDSKTCGIRFWGSAVCTCLIAGGLPPNHFRLHQQQLWERCTYILLESGFRHLNFNTSDLMERERGADEANFPRR